MRIVQKNKVFIIAEAGVNHNGRLEIAYKLVDAAKKAGCDAIKFQTFKTEKFVSSKAPLAGYQKEKGGKNTNNQFDLIKKLELSIGDFSKIKTYCDRHKIMFLSTPFDRASAQDLKKLKMPVFKISSGEITNLPFLRQIGAMKKTVILSTGMSTLDEVRVAVKTIKKSGTKNIILLHCLTEYPAPFEEINLKSIQTLAKTFKCPVGFSDHTKGIEASVAAVALGAKVIEKHLTLDRQMSGPDHKASLEPQELGTMVRCIRNIEKALGTGEKKPAKSEKKYIPVVRKSLVAAHNIEKGHRLGDHDIEIKRPGWGIAPKEWKKVVGLRARFNIKKDDVLLWKQLA